MEQVPAVNITTNPNCPDKKTVKDLADATALELQEQFPNREIEVVECLLSHFQVRIKFPFRTEHRRWDEKGEPDA